MARVLLVDDDPQDLRVLELSLSRDHYEICTAASGRQAIDIGARFLPDVLVCDWMLKDAIHGLDVYEVLRIVDPLARTILITGFLSKDLCAQADQMQIFRFIEKPFELHHMQVAVRLAAAQRRSAVYLPVGVMLLDANGRIIYVNPQGQGLLTGARLTRAASLTDVMGWDALISSERRWVPVFLGPGGQVRWFVRAKKWLDAEGWLLIFVHKEEQSYINHPALRMLLELHEPPRRRWPTKGRALLVDENELVRRAIDLELREADCACHTAETLQAGLALFERDPEIGVVILDWDTESDDVGPFVERLRAVRPDTVIVGYGRFERRHELAAHGMTGFMQKPWRVEDLINVLTDRIGNCVTCSRAIPLRRPHAGDAPRQWICCGCGAKYFAVCDDDFPPDVLENVRPAESLHPIHPFAAT